MAKLYEVDPESFVQEKKQLPAHGRGAWTKTGIGFDYRYRTGSPSIGTVCEKSLDHWAVAAGCWAVQKRLISLGFMDPVDKSERGIFGKKSEAAVKAFQAKNKDPQGDVKLAVDGTVGMSDARSLFTPLVVAAEKKYDIPDHLLLGETNHESSMDPGAIGYYIYYPGYRGVDRGMSQINSLFNPDTSWLQAFDPEYSVDWSAKRLRTFFDSYNEKYPRTDDSILWDAAICAHNNPSAANHWASEGAPTTDAAAKYVSSVKTAVYLKEA